MLWDPALRKARKLLAEAERQVRLRRWDPRQPRPLSSLARPAWLEPIAFKGARDPFLNRPPPSALQTPGPHPLVEALLGGLRVPDLVARDPLPIPAAADRELYNGEQDFDWWLSGLRDYLTARRVLERHGASLRPGDALLELGCSTGRALRHWVCQEEGLECWGADINLRSVEWLRTYFPQRVRVFQNTVLPQLPLEDRSLGLVFAYSVFTHIDELELAWVAELRRVLRPGAIALITVHSEQTWKNMRPGWPIRDALWSVRDKISEHDVSEELFAQPLPAPRTVFWWKKAWGLQSSVFHSHDYLRGAWGRFFEVLEIIVSGHDYQDLVVLRRPP